MARHGAVSTAITNGIRVTVSTVYVPSQSAPAAHRYVFAYTVRIANEGAETAQLKSRHWIITDGNGKVEEVRGPGVVGQQPVLKPGRALRVHERLRARDAARVDARHATRCTAPTAARVRRRDRAVRAGDAALAQLSDAELRRGRFGAGRGRD